MSTQWLAQFFTKQREIIEAAETPFAKLAIFILPILTPMVPAFMTGVHTYQLFLEIFTFDHKDTTSLIMSMVIAVSLELLGYVGAVSFIKSMFDWIKYRRDEYILPLGLNLAAYVFYLVAMYLINVQLGRYFGTPDIVNSIFALLSFITVPSGFLVANHLNETREQELSDKERRETEASQLRSQKQRSEIELEKLRLKLEAKRVRESHGESQRVSTESAVSRTSQRQSQSVSQPTTASSQERIYALMSQTYESEERVMGFSEIVNAGFEKSSASRYRSKWLDDHPKIKKRMGF